MPTSPIRQVIRSGTKVASTRRIGPFTVQGRIHRDSRGDTDRCAAVPSSRLLLPRTVPPPQTYIENTRGRNDSCCPLAAKAPVDRLESEAAKKLASRNHQSPGFISGQGRGPKEWHGGKVCRKQRQFARMLPSESVLGRSQRNPIPVLPGPCAAALTPACASSHDSVPPHCRSVDSPKNRSGCT